MNDIIEELQAQLAKLAGPMWAVTATRECLGEIDEDFDIDDPDLDWCLYDAGEDDPPLAFGMMRQHAEAIAAVVNSCPEIIAALRQADADRAAFQEEADTARQLYVETILERKRLEDRLAARPS